MGTVVDARPARNLPWGFPASLLIHALLALAVLLSPAVQELLPVAPEASVAVEILTQRQFRAIAEPERASTPAVVPPVAAPESAALPPANPAPRSAAPSGVIVAKTMLSQKTLADPRSRQARRDLSTFSDSERVVQLCNLEAMDQIAAWQDSFRPDRVVAYARSDVRLSGETVVADGAAFRSRERWYDVRFSCEVAPDHAKVVAFQFQVGDPVPRKDWEDLSLPAVH
ncbi:MAG: DUF930 domain-containing protein [Hyphomicrobiales bacterium]|nr:DUF930 domain-containing protein [Hyphomicrobiales bacterium]